MDPVSWRAFDNLLRGLARRPSLPVAITTKLIVVDGIVLPSYFPPVYNLERHDLPNHPIMPLMLLKSVTESIAPLTTEWIEQSI